MNSKYGKLFEGWEIAVAIKLVSDYREQWKCLRLDDVEDLLQECLAHWVFAKDKYDPLKEASQKTFMARVVRNKLRDLVKERAREKRKVAQNSISLDAPVLPDDENSPSLVDTLEEEAGYSARLILQACLKVDLQKTTSQLTPVQRKLCRLLGEEGLNMYEASQELKTPRSTLYEEIKRIRAIFEKENLREWL